MPLEILKTIALLCQVSVSSVYKIENIRETYPARGTVVTVDSGDLQRLCQKQYLTCMNKSKSDFKKYDDYAAVLTKCVEEK